ncbi:hypothetical protein Tco_1437364 [Tanacetum coccineum]
MDDEEDDEVTKELYNDVNMNLGNRDADMTDAIQGGAVQQNVSQESGFEQVEEDAHVTLTPVLDIQKTDEPVQSSFVSSNFTSKLLNLKNPSLADNAISSLMDTIVRHKEPRSQISSLYTVPIMAVLEITSIPPPPLFNPLLQQATPTPTPTTSEATTSFPSLLDFSSVFKFNDRVTNLEKDLSEIKQVDQGVETAETKIKTPPLDQTERRNEGSQARKLSHPEIQGQRKRSLQAPLNTPPTLNISLLETFELLKGTCKSLTELEYHLEECSKSTTERLDQHNPEVKLYPFDLSKPLPLIPYHRGHQVIPQDFFINNDLKYLKGGDLSRRMLTWALHTEVPNVNDSTEDQQLYKFRKGDLPRLQDIEDILLLLIQQKLTNLTIDKRYDLNVALSMFTRRIVIQRQVEDLQLGVKSYQKKLNLTKPDIFRSNIRNRSTYTAYSDPKGVIYKDQNNKNRLMCADELHKFSDGTLNDVRTALYDIAKGIRMEYLPKRKWSGLDKRRAQVMV